MSLLGGLVVGLVNYVTILYTVDTVALQLAAPQWPIIIAGGFAGLAGSLLDSILGATLQYSGASNQHDNIHILSRSPRYIAHACYHVSGNDD